MAIAPFVVVVLFVLIVLFVVAALVANVLFVVVALVVPLVLLVVAVPFVMHRPTLAANDDLFFLVPVMHRAGLPTLVDLLVALGQRVVTAVVPMVVVAITAAVFVLVVLALAAALLVLMVVALAAALLVFVLVALATALLVFMLVAFAAALLVPIRGTRCSTPPSSCSSHSPQHSSSSWSWHYRALSSSCSSHCRSTPRPRPTRSRPLIDDLAFEFTCDRDDRPPVARPDQADSPGGVASRTLRLDLHNDLVALLT